MTWVQEKWHRLISDFSCVVRWWESYSGLEILNGTWLYVKDVYPADRATTSNILWRFSKSIEGFVWQNSKFKREYAEKTIKEIIIVAPKAYEIRFEDGTTIIKFKGVKTDLLTSEHPRWDCFRNSSPINSKVLLVTRSNLLFLETLKRFE